MLYSPGKIDPSIMITPRLKHMINNTIEDKLVVLDGVVGSGRTRFMKAQRSILEAMDGHETTWITPSRVASDSSVSGEGLKEILQAILDRNEAGKQQHVYIPDIELLSAEDLAHLESFILRADDSMHVVVSVFSESISYFKHPQLNSKATEISYADLVFNKNEINAIVKKYDPSLGNDYAARVYELTLGWPLFVELSLMKASSIQELEKLCEAHSFQRERIVEGILDNLRPDELDLLADLCMLDEFDSTFVGRVTDHPFPERAISRLVSLNIFVSSLSGKTNSGGGYYRCHPFLVSSIRSYVYANVSNHDLKKKMIKIIACYEDDGEHLRAFQIAFASGVYDHAFRILVKNLFLVLPHVDEETLRHLVDSYYYEDELDMYLYYLIAAWTVFLSGKYRRTRLLLGKAERCRRDVVKQLRTRGAFLLGQTIRVGCDVLEGKYENAISMGSELVRYMGGPRLFMRCSIMQNMGEAYLRLGMYSEAKDAFLRASVDARVSGRNTTELLCEAEIAWLKFVEGNLDASSNVVLRALARAKADKHRYVWSVGVLYVSFARLYLQWCETDKVHYYLDRAAEVLSPDNNRDAYLESKVTLARVLELEGKREESYEQMVMAHEMTLWDNIPRGVDMLVTVTFANMLVTRDRYDEAIQLIDGMLEKASPGDDFYRIHAEIVRAQALVLGYGEVEKATDILEEALKRANEKELWLMATFCKVKLACVYRIKGREQDAIDFMTQVLEECADEGRMYLFVYPLPFQNALIYEIAFPTSSNLVIDSSRKSARDYARKIIGRLKEWDYQENAIEESEMKDEDRYAELTARERDVCELLKQGKTRQQIADELGLKLNTVRTHIRSVYKKLNIHERSML